MIYSIYLIVQYDLGYDDEDGEGDDDADDDDDDDPLSSMIVKSFQNFRSSYQIMMIAEFKLY